MNKWVKWGYLGFAAAVIALTLPMALVSLGLGVMSLYISLVGIGFFVLEKTISKKTRRIWIGSIILVYLYLHTFTASSVMGRIIDKTTKKPIENAIVHAEYRLTFPTIGGGVGYPVGERLAVTDANGVYKLKSIISYGCRADRQEGIYARILRPFTSFFEMFSPVIDVKVLHPLWEAKRKMNYPDNCDTGCLWMIKKIWKPIRYDEELLSLGEINKGKATDEKQWYELNELTFALSHKSLGTSDRRLLVNTLEEWQVFKSKIPPAKRNKYIDWLKLITKDYAR